MYFENEENETSNNNVGEEPPIEHKETIVEEYETDKGYRNLINGASVTGDSSGMGKGCSFFLNSLLVFQYFIVFSFASISFLFSSFCKSFKITWLETFHIFPSTSKWSRESTPSSIVFSFMGITWKSLSPDPISNKFFCNSGLTSSFILYDIFQDFFFNSKISGSFKFFISFFDWITFGKMKSSENFL